MSTEEPPSVASRPKRANRRLRVLLALNALVFGIYLFAQLDRPLAQSLGPLAESVHNLLRPSAETNETQSATARQFVKDVKVLGGEPNVALVAPGFLGIFGRSEWFNVAVRNRAFDDRALGRLAELHGGRIGGLYLQNTGVSDSGLLHLQKFTMLRHLEISDVGPRTRRGASIRRPAPKVTDAGLVYLKGVTTLQTLNLSGIPVTDQGLDAIKALPALYALYLSRTKVEGPGLARLKSLPKLSVLCLDQSEMSEEGLKALARASGLEYLSLSQVPLSEKALPLLKAIPRLKRVELSGCGLLDEEADALAKSKPGLTVVRQ